MSLHWYACISTNTYCFEMHHIPLETDWWALSNTSSIAWICSAVLEILADEAFTAIDGLISQSFIVTFVHPTHMWIALIWGFLVQLGLWKSVYWLWRYKLNEVCDKEEPCIRLTQENLIKNSAQDCLPYILKLHGLCWLLLAYPKQPCVCFEVNMYLNILSNVILPEPSTLFHVTHDYDLCHVTGVWQ